MLPQSHRHIATQAHAAQTHASVAAPRCWCPPQRQCHATATSVAPVVWCHPREFASQQGHRLEFEAGTCVSPTQTQRHGGTRAPPLRPPHSAHTQAAHARGRGVIGTALATMPGSQQRFARLARSHGHCETLGWWRCLASGLNFQGCCEGRHASEVAGGNAIGVHMRRSKALNGAPGGTKTQ